jgi:hypothetical protein
MTALDTGEVQLRVRLDNPEDTKEIDILKAYEVLSAKAGLANDPHAKNPQVAWQHEMFRHAGTRSEPATEFPISTLGSGVLPSEGGDRVWTIDRIDDPCHAMAILCSVRQLQALGAQPDDSSNEPGRLSPGEIVSSARQNEADIIALLLQVTAKKNIALRTWARVHKIGRTTFFDWKRSLKSGAPLKSKVSLEKAAAIEAAVRRDAEELGLIARTSSD